MPGAPGGWGRPDPRSYSSEDFLSPDDEAVAKSDQLPGGKADKKKPSDFDQALLKEGSEHEMEHTSNIDIAVEIAMDHLAEDPSYYKKLRKVEG